jgi:SnoaL-like protein
MTGAQNKAIFLRFIDELRRGNLDVIDEVCSPDFAFHSPNWPNWPRGIEGARKLATYGSQLYRDARVMMDDIIAEHDRLAVRWTITGTWIGPQRPGSPPYGGKPNSDTGGSTPTWQSGPSDGAPADRQDRVGQRNV